MERINAFLSLGLPEIAALFAPFETSLTVLGVTPLSESMGNSGYAVETIAKEMEASRYHIRTPAFWDGLPGSYTQAFGMIKWYDLGLHSKYFAQQDAYLGLGFD